MAASDGRGGRGGRGCGGSGGGGVTRGQGGGGGAHVESGGAGTEGGRTAISDLVPHQPNTVSLYSYMMVSQCSCCFVVNLSDIII